MSRLEKFSEAEFVKDVERVGGFAIKIYNRAGWPDRLVWLPAISFYKGVWFWAEWKRKNLPPEPHQSVIHKQLRDIGHTVFIFDDNEQARETIRKYLAL